MATKIVIPSDLKLESIDHLRSILQFQTESELQVVLLHGIYPSNSISELLFFDKSDLKIAIAGRDFLKQIALLEDELASKVKTIQIDFFAGFTQSSFNDYLETIKVDRVLIPNDFEFNWSHKQSMDILPFLAKCKVVKQFLSSNQDAAVTDGRMVYKSAFS